jgi:SAM-dependent methyltransferase
VAYSENYFSQRVRHWQAQGWLPQGGRLIDFGAQVLHGDPAVIRGELATLGISLDRPTVADVYRALGVDYIAIDVDGSNGSLFFDLNTQAPPADWIGAFDMVNNEGTIEHLANPMNGLHVAHDLVKVGGVVCHSAPMVGHRKHGLFNPTPKMWSNLMLANRYQQLEALIDFQEDDPSFGYTDFTVRDRTGKHTSRATASNAWVHLAYRKTRDAPFAVPTDHLLFPLGQVVSADLSSNFERWAAARPVAPAHVLRPTGPLACALGSIAKFLAWKLSVGAWLAVKGLLPRR